MTSRRCRGWWSRATAPFRGMAISKRSSHPHAPGCSLSRWLRYGMSTTGCARPGRVGSYSQYGGGVDRSDKEWVPKLWHDRAGGINVGAGVPGLPARNGRKEGRKCLEDMIWLKDWTRPEPLMQMRCQWRRGPSGWWRCCSECPLPPRPDWRRRCG